MWESEREKLRQKMWELRTSLPVMRWAGVEIGMLMMQ